MNQENKQLPTAEETLISVIMPNFRQVFGDNDTEWIVKAMQEHTRLHTAPLREELEKLRAWKESAMKTLSDVGLHECGKLLNIGLGQSIADKIVPGIKEIKAENERLKSTPGNTQVILAEGYNRLDAENQKLREALEFLIENNMCSIKGDEIAKEALKGGQGE